MTIYEFSKQVANLKKQQNYSLALEFFKEHKHNFQMIEIVNNKWLISDLITILRKTNKSKIIHKFLKKYNININEDTDELILNAYGWCLYNNIKDKVYNKNQLIQVLEYPLYLLFRINTKFSYMIISNILREGLKLTKEHQQQDFKFTNDFLNLFDKSLLSLECNHFEVRDKVIEQASDREKWYSEKSKALFELKSFEECCLISEEALHTITQFHHNNDLWFARRIALSKRELGNINEAIKDLKRIYIKKKEWFIKKEISELYFEKNDIDNAFQYAMLAINDQGKLDFKIGLILLIGKILKTKNEIELAYQHFLLVKKIRENNQWKISNELLDEITYLDIDIEYDIEYLIKHLKNYWKSFLPKKEILKGKIKKILNNNKKGKDGFIYTDNNQEYYFSIPAHISFIDKIENNVEINFELIKLQDGRQKAKILKVETV